MEWFPHAYRAERIRHAWADAPDRPDIMVRSLSGLGPGDGKAGHPVSRTAHSQPPHAAQGNRARIKNHLFLTGLLCLVPAAQCSDAAAGQGEVQG